VESIFREKSGSRYAFAAIRSRVDKSKTIALYRLGIVSVASQQDELLTREYPSRRTSNDNNALLVTYDVVLQTPSLCVGLAFRLSRPANLSVARPLM
jgi:hypothetical protein